MRSRLIIIIAAIVLGAVAAFGSGRYLQVEQSRIAQGAQLVPVLVAQQDLPLGMTADELLAKGYLALREIPRQYVANAAVSSRVRLQGKVVAQPISKDQQVTDAMFKYAAEVGLASSTPKGYVAVSIPYESARGVAGLLKPGDFVAVLGTFEPQGKGADAARTKVILSKVKVLAVGKALDAAPQTSQTTRVSSSGMLSSSSRANEDQTPGTITLALAPADAEKLVFAQEEGKVWLALFSPSDPGTPSTTGATLQTVER